MSTRCGNVSINTNADYVCLMDTSLIRGGCFDQVILPKKDLPALIEALQRIVELNQDVAATLPPIQPGGTGF